MEEDYELLNIEDPEDVTEIKTNIVFPNDKVGKESIEVVPVSNKDLQEQNKKQNLERTRTSMQDSYTAKNEKTFITDKHTRTKSDLDKREDELIDLINRK